ncbi:hypothetical protein GDO86_018542, partial [Hymenochirus boettgeri]
PGASPNRPPRLRGRGARPARCSRSAPRSREPRPALPLHRLFWSRPAAVRGRGVPGGPVPLGRLPGVGGRRAAHRATSRHTPRSAPPSRLRPAHFWQQTGRRNPPRPRQPNTSAAGGAIYRVRSSHRSLRPMTQEPFTAVPGAVRAGPQPLLPRFVPVRLAAPALLRLSPRAGRTPPPPQHGGPRPTAPAFPGTPSPPRQHLTATPGARGAGRRPPTSHKPPPARARASPVGPFPPRPCPLPWGGSPRAVPATRPDTAPPTTHVAPRANPRDALSASRAPVPTAERAPHGTPPTPQPPAPKSEHHPPLRHHHPALCVPVFWRSPPSRTTPRDPPAARRGRAFSRSAPRSSLARLSGPGPPRRRSPPRGTRISGLC